MIKKIVYLLLTILLIGQSHAQSVRDTTAMLKQLAGVMSFTTRPYVYLQTTSTVVMEPVLHQATDSLGDINGEVYKVGNEVYSGSGRTETFIQDSLYLTIDHGRRTVRVRVVDMASKKKLSESLLKRVDVQEMVRGRYTISKSRPQDGVVRFSLAARDTVKSHTTIGIDCDTSTNLPLLMTVEIWMERPLDGRTKTWLEQQPNYSPSLIVQKDGREYWAMRQVARTTFDRISFQPPANVAKMPLWTERLVYDTDKKEFVGIGKCKDYDIR